MGFKDIYKCARDGLLHTGRDPIGYKDLCFRIIIQNLAQMTDDDEYGVPAYLHEWIRELHWDSVMDTEEQLETGQTREQYINKEFVLVDCCGKYIHKDNAVLKCHGTTINMCKTCFT